MTAVHVAWAHVIPVILVVDRARAGSCCLVELAVTAVASLWFVAD